MDTNQPKLCTLHVAATGREERCPGDPCAFWESGGAVLPGGCLVERLHVDVRQPELAAYLLDVRGRVERTSAQRRETRS